MLYGSSCGFRVVRHTQVYPGVFGDTAEGFWGFILMFSEGFVVFKGAKTHWGLRPSSLGGRKILMGIQAFVEVESSGFCGILQNKKVLNSERKENFKHLC